MEQKNTLNDNFWKWFGNSVTVDEKGNPLIFHHGTRQSFDTFKAKYDDKLVFFAYDEKFAKDWAQGAPLTPEQQELKNDLYDEKQRPFNNALVKKVRQKYNTDDLSADEPYAELRKRSDRYEQRLEKQAGISPKVMHVYIKATKIFVPERDYKLVLDDIIAYYGWKNPNDKDYQEKLRQKTDEFDKINKEEMEWIKNNKDKSDEEISQHEHNIDKAFKSLQICRNIANDYNSNIERIKKGAWVYFEHKEIIDKIFDTLGFDAIQLSENRGIPTTLAVREGTDQIKAITNTTFSNSTNIYEAKSLNEQLMYHGTNQEFDAFDKKFMGRMDYGYGFYFTTDKQYALDYGKYLLTCEIPDDKYFLDFDMAWDTNDYIESCLVGLLIHLSEDKQKLLETVMYRDYCNSGFWILDTLRKIYGSEEKACQELRNYGIKGLWSFNGNCYVVFDSKDIKIVKKELVESYKKTSVFLKLNEQLQRYMNEEAAMKQAPQNTFEQFYAYCIKNPKLQQKLYYECFNGHIRIPSDTINHAWKKHKTSCEQWLDMLSNISNIMNVGKSKDKTLGRPTILCRIRGREDYGFAMADCPDYFYVMTLFEDPINSIDNWIETGSIRRPISQLSAPVSKADSVTHGGIKPNDIIHYIIEKIKR